jgi:ribonuclease-3
MTLKFKNQSLLKLAFTHRSALPGLPKGQRCSNERLEFLGDSILSFIVSEHLCAAFPKKSEGELTTLRSLLVKTKTLARVAKTLEFTQKLILSKSEEDGGGRQNEGILADCFESFLAALYLDQGLDAARSFVQENIITLISEVEGMSELKDYKSLLQEKIQSLGHPSPRYKIVKEEGPDHAKVFTAEVYDDGKRLGAGTGHTKQEAEVTAAKDGLGMI